MEVDREEEAARKWKRREETEKERGLLLLYGARPQTAVSGTTINSIVIHKVFAHQLLTHETIAECLLSAKRCMRILGTPWISWLRQRLLHEHHGDQL